MVVVLTMGHYSAWWVVGVASVGSHEQTVAWSRPGRDAERACSPLAPLVLPTSQTYAASNTCSSTLRRPTGPINLTRSIVQIRHGSNEIFFYHFFFKFNLNWIYWDVFLSLDLIPNLQELFLTVTFIMTNYNEVVTRKIAFTWVTFCSY